MPDACLGHHVPFTYSFIPRSQLQANPLQKKQPHYIDLSHIALGSVKVAFLCGVLLPLARQCPAALD